MADDEQFSLCWNNFNSNLSAGFHESLCRGDLVDVTLAAEGQFVKAHRLVLSVCSPYFRKMFTQMPANQHAFVFLKDVSHSALKDLIQFMYCGEVNVKQEALPAFISTAEALQIKGLTDGDPAPPQTPPEPTTPTPQVQQMASSPRTRTRNSTSHSYKVETLDDSASEEAKPHATQMIIHTATSNQGPAAIVHHTAPQQQHHLQTTQTQQIVTAAPATATTTVLSHKRPAQRNLGSVPHIKRTKSTIETIDTSDHHQTAVQQQQITVQTAVVTTDKGHQPAETEYIDLPIELPTKSEPEYAEEAGDVESGEQDGTYVEDDSYGDIRYDESYFTENEDTGPNVTSAPSVNSQSAAPTTSKALVKQQPGSFSDSSYVETGNGQGDQTGGEAQETIVIATIPSVPKTRQGRSRKQNPTPKRTVAREKVKIAIENNVGVPLVYASTIKGSMKLIYEGHHFIYFFRQGQYTIFQCCYRKCPVKIVSDQKLVYPLEGEHIHYMKATDKSATSIKIANVSLIDTPMDTSETSIIIEQQEQKVNVDETTEQTLRSILTEDSNDQYQETQMQTAEIGDVVTYLPLSNVEEQLAEMFEDTSTSSFPIKVRGDLSSLSNDNDNGNETNSSTGDPNEAKDFRDKIKQRLQAALLQRRKK